MGGDAIAIAQRRKRDAVKAVEDALVELRVASRILRDLQCGVGSLPRMVAPPRPIPDDIDGSPARVGVDAAAGDPAGRSSLTPAGSSSVPVGRDYKVVQI